MVNILYVLKSKSKYILAFDCSRDIYVQCWQTALGTYMSLENKCTFIFIFFKNKLLKYITIRLHNLKSDTYIHIH